MRMSKTNLAVTPVLPSAGKLQPLGLGDVAVTGGYWAGRRDVNHDATLPHIASWLEREGWIGNFDLAAAGTLPEGRRGREFADSEVYKFLEAVFWDLAVHPDPGLEATAADFVRRVAAAQEPDGYLSTAFGRDGQEPRWSDLEWGHELYCLGHLFQAAVARHRTRSEESGGIVDVARRAADMVCREFGPDARQGICGHAEVEVALAELGRALGEPRYLEQARVFVERHGRGSLADIEFGRSYFQDDLPVREATVLRGHSVRANYLSSGAVDVAVETGDDELLQALQGQWANTVARRTYVTGGQGSHHQDEAFGEDYELPNDRAYSETCAGIGSVMFSWRLLLATGDVRYADHIERTLFNVVATGLAPDGRAFFYTNTLHRRTPTHEASPDEMNPRASSAMRAPWFGVSCCPPNIARTIASLPAYLATVDDGGVQLHQYASATVAVDVRGERVEVEVETAYPDDGLVRVRVAQSPSDAWTLSLRVPAWAGRGVVRVLPAAGGQEDFTARAGTFRLERAFAAGDVVELDLDVEPRMVEPDPRIDASRGCVALERGPLVLALESVDLPDGLDVNQVEVVQETPNVDAGVTSVRLRVREDSETSWPYGSGQSPASRDLGRVPLVAYHNWATRGPSTMRIWIPVAD